MAKPTTYHEQTQIDYTLRLRELLKTLPPFARDFFRAMEPVSSIPLAQYRSNVHPQGQDWHMHMIFVFFTVS